MEKYSLFPVCIHLMRRFMPDDIVKIVTLRNAIYRRSISHSLSAIHTTATDAAGIANSRLRCE